MDGLSAEPLRQKTNYLRQLVQEVSYLKSQIWYAYMCIKSITIIIKVVHDVHT